MKSIIKIEDLSLAYHRTPVIWDMDVEIPEGKRIAIIGPNGAGKSTLLKGILKFLPAMTGTVTIFDEVQRGKVLTPSVAKRIAYVPQTGSVNWDFPTTVFDVVLMGRYGKRGWIKRMTKEDKEKAMESIIEMGLEDFASRQISQLSGGQKQRTFIARALCQDAALYIMDEPLAGVDQKTEEIIMNKLVELQKAGKTCIAVHHDLNTAHQYFDYGLLVNKTLIGAGAIDYVLQKEMLDKTYGDAGAVESIRRKAV